MYRVTVGPHQRPMAATKGSRTPAAARAWAPETRQLCRPNSRYPKGTGGWDLRSPCRCFDSGYHGCFGADSTRL